MDDALARIRERAKSYTASISLQVPPTRDGLGDPRSVKVQKDSVDTIGREDAPAEGFFATAAQGREAFDSDVDVAILCALPSPELDQAMEVFGAEWRREIRQGVAFRHGVVRLGDRDLSLVLACQNDMGLVPAAILTTKTMLAWRPSLIAMVGVCAGVRDKVNLGDVVIARQVFDYGSGKLTDGRLHPDFQPVSIDDQLHGYAIDLAGDGDALDAIRDRWPLKSARPDTELHAHVGALGSGAAVVASAGVVEEVVQHQRSLLAVDMEAYGVARAVASSIWSARSLVVKGVQDFADAEKNDSFREYAAFVSAHFLREFLDRYWSEFRAVPPPPHPPSSFI